MFLVQVIFVTDTIANTNYNAFAPSNFTNKIFVSPQVTFYNNTSVKYGTHFVKTFNASNAETFVQDGTVVIDPVIWQKVEVWFGVPSDATSQAFDRINLLLNSSADYTNSSYYVDNVQIYEVTEYDFLYNQYYHYSIFLHLLQLHLTKIYYF